MQMPTTKNRSTKSKVEDFDQQGFETAAKEPSVTSLFRRGILQAFKALCLGLLFLLFCAPLYQYKFEPIPRKAIYATNFPSHRPPLFTWSTFINGEFQPRFNDWFLKRNGLYGYLVRLSNEFTYRVFQQFSVNYGTTILVGNEGQLFQPMYLSAFNKQDVPPENVFEQRARELKRLQERLRERGIATTLVLSTNLLEFYPELIPDSFIDPSRGSRKSKYEIMRPLLDKHELNYVDGHELLSKKSV